MRIVVAYWFSCAWQAGASGKKRPFVPFADIKATSHFRCVYDFNFIFGLQLGQCIDTRLGDVFPCDDFGGTGK